mgnify:CR=1 FL=1
MRGNTAGGGGAVREKNNDCLFFSRGNALRTPTLRLIVLGYPASRDYQLKPRAYVTVFAFTSQESSSSFTPHFVPLLVLLLPRLLRIAFQALWFAPVVVSH